MAEMCTFRQLEDEARRNEDLRRGKHGNRAGRQQRLSPRDEGDVGFAIDTTLHHSTAKLLGTALESSEEELRVERLSDAASPSTEKSLTAWATFDTALGKRKLYVRY